MKRVILACLLGFALAASAAAQDFASLAARYAALRPAMATSAFHRPLAVESGESDGRMRGEIAGELEYPFASVARRLTDPASWCDIVVLHINVKGCAAQGDVVTVYSGRKFYEPLDRAYALRYTFRTNAPRADYVRIELAADEGPLGTSAYEIVLEAMPIGERTFVMLRYAFRPSTPSRLATATYLATLGSAKAGFTVVGWRSDGSPEWIGGVRGIVERNAMRNFLALDAWLATCDARDPDRTLRRMAALTDQYPAQLVEMPSEEYVAMKRRERRENAIGS